jgi:predicted RNA-binding protein with PIN domain
MPYLIDGHNLIAHLDDLVLTDPHDEAKLILKLRGFTARVQKKCIVIFDRGLPGGTSSLSTHPVKVVFAAAHQTSADRIIMERIQRTPDANNWTVVSSDEEIRIAAQSAGMNAMHCAAFARKVNPPPKQKPHRGIDAHVRVSEDEIDEWLDIFGDEVEISGNDITPAKPVRPARRKSAPRAKQQRSAAPSGKQTASRNQPGAESNSKKKTKKTMPEVRAEAGQDDVHVSDKEVEAWLDVFDDGTDREPTDKAQRIRPRHQPEKKDKPAASSGSDAPDENSVEAWLDVFGEEDTSRQPTDPAPQRKRPDKQGHFGSKKTRRDPSVHKNMGTSEDVFLSDGEVEAWMDLFERGTDDDD